MNRLLSATAALLLAVSSVGCCCTGYSITACDPCGRELAGGGCCLRKLFHPHEWSCLKCKCHHHGCAPMGGCCDSCGGQGYGGAFGDPALSYATGGGCGCDGGGGMAPGYPAMAPSYPAPAAAYPPPAPTPVPAAVPAPSPVPGIPGAMHHVPVPTTQARPMAMMAQRAAAPAPTMTAQATPGPQSVSYEEFQRLPGVMVSAPGATAQAAPPVLPNVAPNPQVQPTNWAPSK